MLIWSGVLVSAFHLIPTAPTATHHRAVNANMALVGEQWKPTLLKQLLSARAQQAGKRAVLFFYEDTDEACSDELQALNDVGGELYLKACEVVAVRNPNGAARDSSVRFPFVSFVEDRRDCARLEVGVAHMRESYVVDSTGTIISVCAASEGHACKAMETAREFGWEREAGWERDFGGDSSSEPPSAAERQAADAVRRQAQRDALRLPGRKGESKEQTELERLTEELFTTGMFAEWEDPDAEQYSNPVGDNLARWKRQIERGLTLNELKDDALDALDAARARLNEPIKKPTKDGTEEGDGSNKP